MAGCGRREGSRCETPTPTEEWPYLRRKVIRNPKPMKIITWTSMNMPYVEATRSAGDSSGLGRG